MTRLFSPKLTAPTAGHLVDPLDQLPLRHGPDLTWTRTVPTATETAVTVARPDSYFSQPKPTQQLMVL